MPWYVSGERAGKDSTINSRGQKRVLQKRPCNRLNFVQKGGQMAWRRFIKGEGYLRLYLITGGWKERDNRGYGMVGQDINNTVGQKFAQYVACAWLARHYHANKSSKTLQEGVTRKYCCGQKAMLPKPGKRWVRRVRSIFSIWKRKRGWWRGTESTLSMSGQLLSSSSPRSWRRAGDDDPRNVVQHLPSLTSYSRYIMTGRMHCASCIKIVRGTCMFLRLRLLVTRHSFYWINAQISDIRPIHPHLVISAESF